MLSSVTSSFMAGHRRASPVVPAGNLRLWYDFFQNSCYPGTGIAVNDLTTYNNDGIFTTAPTYTASPTPAPYIRNQSGATINCTFATTDLNISTTVARTASMWIRIPTTTAWVGSQTLFKIENSTNFDGYQMTVKDDGSLTILTNGSVVVRTASTPAGDLPGNVWKMLTFTAIASSTVSSVLYINGVARISMLHGADSVGISSEPLSLPAAAGYGQLSEFRMYDYGLSSTEILTLFNTTRGRYGV